MKQSRYSLFCALSGLVWGFIGYAVARNAFGTYLWAGVAASPFIGLLVGVTFRRGSAVGPVFRALIALVSLYAAVMLFGLVVGLTEASLYAVPSDPLLMHAIEDAFGMLKQMTLMGWLMVFWPLALINHSLLWHFDVAVQPRRSN